MQTKKLSIPNENNKLLCDGFVHIQFAPPHETVREADFNEVYEIDVDETVARFQLVDFLRLPFNSIGSAFTVPATGMRSDEWRDKWIERYPKTERDTELAVYCYKKI